MTMSLHYSTTTTARERDGTTPSYPQGHQRAAVNLQDWKVFQKETNRHLRVERISPYGFNLAGKYSKVFNHKLVLTYFNIL